MLDGCSTLGVCLAALAASPGCSGTLSTMSAGQRSKGVLSSARSRAEGVSRRARERVDRQDAGSRSEVAINAWRRYRAVDGPLQSLLLTAYVVIAVLPALLVMEEYLDSNPRALTAHLVNHFDLSATTASLLGSVLAKTNSHETVSALLAIVGALFFGLGFGRVLQLVHARAWRISLPKRQTDQARYAAVLLGLYGLILLLLLQTTEIAEKPSWAGLALAPGWVALLIVYFVWAPRLLTRKLISRRDLLPGAAVTAVGLVGLMLISSHAMEPWVDLYAQDYGGFGVVMAVFFWLGFSSTVIVAAASLSPALAERRRLRARPAPQSF
jgi:membrane protein